VSLDRARRSRDCRPSGAAKSTSPGDPALLRSAVGQVRMTADVPLHAKSLAIRLALLQIRCFSARPFWENIALRRPRRADEDTVRARKWRTRTSYRDLPQGYATMVGDRGRGFPGAPAPAHRDRQSHRPQHTILILRRTTRGSMPLGASSSSTHCSVCEGRRANDAHLSARSVTPTSSCRKGSGVVKHGTHDVLLAKGESTRAAPASKRTEPARRRQSRSEAFRACPTDPDVSRSAGRSLRPRPRSGIRPRAACGNQTFRMRGQMLGRAVAEGITIPVVSSSTTQCSSTSAPSRSHEPVTCGTSPPIRAERSTAGRRRGVPDNSSTDWELRRKRGGGTRHRSRPTIG